MKWETYDLYIESVETNEIMQPISSQTFLQKIACVVSYNLYSTVSGDMVYRKVAPSAITTFKGFTLENTYYLKGKGHEYKVASFNTKGRFTQLVLEEIYTKEA